MRIIIFIISLFSLSVYAQEKYTELPDDIHESSALVKYEDVFISLNDSGNKNALYVFDRNGEILNECVISNATNIDWEALTFDGDSTLFIGDIGNNQNVRKDQRIYSVSLYEVISDSTTQAGVIDFNYPDQELFPPEEKDLYYDAETLIYRNDSLFILTKNRTVPFDGLIKVYGLSTIPGKQTPERYPNIHLEASSWIEDSATDGVLYGNHLFLMTYSKVCVFDWNGSSFTQSDTIYHFDFFTQKEGIAVDDKYIYISEENEEKLSESAFLYRIKR